MLRGLDADAAVRSEYQPPVVEVADRDPFEGTVSLYVHESPSPSVHRRFVAARSRLELLAEAGVVEGTRFVAWPARTALSGTGEACELGSLYRQFRDATGAAALDPFFERADGELAVPELAVALRRDGALTGLYPLATDEDTASVEDGISRLVAGEAVENVAGG